MTIEDDYKILKLVSETKDLELLRSIETSIEFLFYYVIEISDVSVVQFLLNTKIVNLKSVTIDGRRPVHIAAQYGNLAIIKSIVNSGSPLNVIDNMGSTPLHLSLEAGFDDAAMYFVREGATINRPFKYHSGESPIHMAAQLGMDRVLDCMLKRGGNSNLQDRSGLTPLHLAVQHRHCSTSLILCQAGAKVDLPDRRGKSPFFMALMQMSCDMVRVLLPFVQQLNSVDIDGRTPLHYIATAPRTSSSVNDIVDLLLDVGVDVTKCDKDGRTALHEASAAGNVTVAEKLIERGAQLNIIDQVLGETPLLMASAYNRIDVMKMLLSYGADPNICDKNKKSPLHKVQLCQNASVPGSKVICSQLLLEAGAKVNAADDRGCTVLDQCIFSYGMKKDQSYLMAILPTLVQAGLRLKPPLQGRARILQNSPLCSLAWNGDLEAAKFLVECGWSLKTENWIKLPGKTPEIDAFFQILRQISRQPMSLQRLCRTTLRDFLIDLTNDTDITSSVMYLPLPWILKPYILCNVGFNSLFD